MSELRYDQAKVGQYRETALRLHELRREVGQRIESAVETGDTKAAQDALAELQASGEELTKMRISLSPTDLFIVTYGVRVHGPHEVSFLLPNGESRFDILSKAQQVVQEQLVAPLDLGDWEQSRAFRALSTTAERFRIIGCLAGGEGLDRANQEALVIGRGFSLPTLADLAVAFAVHYVATGESLFGWHPQFEERSYIARSAQQSLGFTLRGLRMYEDEIFDNDESRDFVVSARVPSTFAGRAEGALEQDGEM